MTGATYATEGSVAVRGHGVWYGIVGRRTDRPPVVVVHGGPGLPHDYLEPVSVLASTGRAVVFYDQLGCGNSDRPDDPALWSVEYFVEELATVVAELGLDRFHLLGHSWGGALAMQYALGHPPGLVSLVLADTFPSMPRVLGEWARLRAELPAPAREVLARHEQAGTTGEPEYQAAFREFFYRRHVCRVDPQPDVLARAFAGAGEQVYGVMWGPDWFEVTGKLRDWDITGRLGEIDVPALVLVGRHDQCPPSLAEALHEAIPRSELVVFEDSSHVPHIEEPDRFREVVAGFLERVEPGASATAP